MFFIILLVWFYWLNDRGVFVLDLVHDAVSQDDIERAIRKSLVDEIGRHSTMDKPKVRALYNWITALMKYLPLREEIFNFFDAKNFPLSPYWPPVPCVTYLVIGDPSLKNEKNLQKKYLHPQSDFLSIARQPRTVQSSILFLNATE